MANKFLNIGAYSSTNISNDIFGATIGASSLVDGTPVKADADGVLVSTLLDISDTIGLQAALDLKAASTAVTLQLAYNNSQSLGTNLGELVIKNGNVGDATADVLHITTKDSYRVLSVNAAGALTIGRDDVVTANDDYTLPNTRASAGQMLTDVSGTGVITWSSSLSTLQEAYDNGGTVTGIPGGTPLVLQSTTSATNSVFAVENVGGSQTFKVRADGSIVVGANAFPSVDGSSGDYLSTNGSGTVAWTTPNEAWYHADNNIAVGSVQNIAYSASSTTKLDLASFTTITSKNITKETSTGFLGFKVAIAGTYSISFHASLLNSTDDGWTQYILYLDDAATTTYCGCDNNFPDHNSVSFNCIRTLAADEVASIFVKVHSASATTISFTSFGISMHLLDM